MSENTSETSKKKTRVDKLWDKIYLEFQDVLFKMEWGKYPVDFHFILEEIYFLKLLEVDCIQDSYYISTFEYFLANDYKTIQFK